jgi:hypothetical protein
VRPTRYKTSRFDSSLFVLQNDAAASAWPCTKAACARLRGAFKSKFTEELELRRQPLFDKPLLPPPPPQGAGSNAPRQPAAVAAASFLAAAEDSRPGGFEVAARLLAASTAEEDSAGAPFTAAAKKTKKTKKRVSEAAAPPTDHGALEPKMKTEKKHAGDFSPASKASKKAKRNLH